MCKPHDCGNHRFYGVFSEDKKRAWGLLVTVKDTDNAILHPSQYATDRWLGKPDQPIKAHLMGQLKASQTRDVHTDFLKGGKHLLEKINGKGKEWLNLRFASNFITRIRVLITQYTKTCIM